MGYQQFLEKGLIAFFRASQGRGLGLLAGLQQLRTTARVISQELIKDDITVYEQGDGASRRVMLEQFRAADEQEVLLGTRSFWEGVDIQQGQRVGYLQAALRCANRSHLRRAQRDLPKFVQRLLGARKCAEVPPRLWPPHPQQSRPRRGRHLRQTPAL